MSELQPVERLSPRHIEQLAVLYQSEWWSKGRSLEDVRTAVANSTLILGFVDPQDDRLVAFCRVLSDLAFRAMVYDVIVAEDQRGSGLGRRLLEGVVSHPKLKRVNSITLACKPELVPFYEQFGFQVTPEDCVWMRRARGEQRAERRNERRDQPSGAGGSSK